MQTEGVLQKQGLQINMEKLKLCIGEETTDLALRDNTIIKSVKTTNTLEFISIKKKN